MPYRDKDKQREAQREWARRARANKRARDPAQHRKLPPLPQSDDPTITEHVGEACVVWLTESVEEVHADERLGSAERARTLATLTGALLKAAEAADLEARLDALEQAWLGAAEAS